MTFRTVLAEIALETARKALAPDAPSRLECVFVSETLDFSRAFRDKYSPGATIYKVAPVGEALKPFRADFDLISSPKNGAPPYLDFMPTEAIDYWTEEPKGLPELLYPGQIIIIEVVE